MFMKMYTGLSYPKLMEQLNGNIHYQMFCDVIIAPEKYASYLLCTLKTSCEDEDLTELLPYF